MDIFSIPDFLLNAIQSECQLAESEGREPQNKGYFYQLLSSHADSLGEDDWLLMVVYFSTFVSRNTAKYLADCSAGNFAISHCSKSEREMSLPLAMASIT